MNNPSEPKSTSDPDVASSDLFACPFCGEKPTPSGHMFSRDRRAIVNQVTHPTTDKCPLDMLVFREGEWQTRFKANDQLCGQGDSEKGT